jgi:hypothetical protein
MEDPMSGIERLNPSPATTPGIDALRHAVARRPVFHLELQKFLIRDTRSIHDDTDVVSFALKVGDDPAVVRIKHMGDVNNGEHLVQLKIGPVTFDGPAPIRLITTIVNSGHKDDAELEDTLTTAANQAIDAALDALPGGEIVELLSHWLVNLFAADCDGVLVAQRWTWTPDELKGHTDTHNPWVVTHSYDGPDASFPCGVSHYTVTWQISREDA